MNQSKLQFADASIIVHHQGAHLSSWIFQGREQLFVSRQAIYKSSKAIRGGVPICFPQFGTFGPGNSHGFARNVVWQPTLTDNNRLRFELGHNEKSLALWPHEFRALFEVKLNKNTLNMCLSVENLSNRKLKFTAALHTYFRLDHIKNALVDGLQGCEFWDNGTDLNQRQTQNQDQLKIDCMIDRVYFNTQKTLCLTDNQSVRKVSSNGFDDTVVWNPWDKGAQDFDDMADDEYQQMLCIESANVQTPVRLHEGETWQGMQMISVFLK